MELSTKKHGGVPHFWPDSMSAVDADDEAASVQCCPLTVKLLDSWVSDSVSAGPISLMRKNATLPPERGRMIVLIQDCDRAVELLQWSCERMAQVRGEVRPPSSLNVIFHLNAADSVAWTGLRRNFAIELGWATGTRAVCINGLACCD